MIQEYCPYVIVKSGGTSNQQALFYPHMPAFVMGSDARCHLQLSDASAAASHAVIHRRNDAYLMVSYALTRVNGHETRQPVILQSGDIIQIGSAALEFRNDDLYDSSLAPRVIESPVTKRPAELPQMVVITPKSTAVKSTMLPKATDVNATTSPKIYFPPQRVETLPGRPFWLLLYTLGLYIISAVLIVVTLQRFYRQTIVDIYSDSTIGIALLVAGIFAVATAYGAYRMTMWGWRLARLACLAWIVVSVFLWVRAFNASPDRNQEVLIVASVLGLTTFAAFDSIIHAAAGASFNEMMGDSADAIVSKTGVPVGGRRIISGYALMGSLGVVGVALIVPMIVAIIAILGDHIVLGGLLLDPDAYSTMIPLEQGLCVLILVGGAAIHVMLLILFNLERARFGTYPPTQA